jgi:uncharacterized protein
MNSTPEYLTVQPGFVLLSLKVQPRSSKNAIAGPLGQELRVTLTSPPVDNAANQDLVRFLADQLNCPRNRIEIVRGQHSRHKQVRITGIPAQTVLQLLVPSPGDILREEPRNPRPRSA